MYIMLSIVKFYNTYILTYIEYKDILINFIYNYGYMYRLNVYRAHTYSPQAISANINYSK